MVYSYNVVRQGCHLFTSTTIFKLDLSMDTHYILHKKLTRSSHQIMKDVVYALTMREIKTRFGTTKMGYFWAIAEPFSQVCILGFIFQLSGRTAIASIPIALFLSISILPFQFIFKKLLTQISAAVNANKALLSYQPVHPMDPVIARILIELALFLISYVVIMLFMLWFGFDAIPSDLLGLLGACALLAIFSIGLGLMACVAQSYYQDAKKIIDMLARPLFFISGIFFAGTSIPQQYWYLFSWNPIFQAIELSRDSFFAVYTTPIASWSYLTLCAVISFGLGLVLFYVNRQRFLTS